MNSSWHMTAMQRHRSRTDPARLLTINTVSDPSAWVFLVQTDAVGRRRKSLNSLQRLLLIPYQLVHPGDNHHLFRAVNHRRHPVAVAIHIHQLSIHCNGIAAGQIQIAGQRLMENQIRILTMIPIQIPDLCAAFQQFHNAALRQGHRSADTDGNLFLQHRGNPFSARLTVADQVNLKLMRLQFGFRLLQLCPLQRR